MMNEKADRLFFASDYMEGAHPAILRKMLETNMLHSAGYGLDEFSESAREKIRKACDAPEADVFFLTGGTQTNATVLDAMLRPYQGVIAASSGHVSVHEAGAIEFGGHKVMELPQHQGKLVPEEVEKCIHSYWGDENHEHMVMPGMVYISQPSEYGTLYSLKELEALHHICEANEVALYLDGARLAYALACPDNDVTLPDIARLCDAFYIGGTKCGALFGEAVVFPRHNTVPHFFTMMKQHGALLAKGRINGIQFDTLFTDDLYMIIGRAAIQAADRIREALIEKGYQMAFNTPTNQIFIVLSKDQAASLCDHIELGFWENPDEEHTVMRIATSWATQKEDVDRLISVL